MTATEIQAFLKVVKPLMFRAPKARLTKRQAAQMPVGAVIVSRPSWS
jgi:hypothetical protein